MSGEKEYRRPDGTTTILPGAPNHVEYYAQKGFTLVEDEVVEEPEI